MVVQALIQISTETLIARSNLHVLIWDVIKTEKAIILPTVILMTFCGILASDIGCTVRMYGIIVW